MFKSTRFLISSMKGCASGLLYIALLKFFLAVLPCAVAAVSFLKLKNENIVFFFFKCENEKAVESFV